VDKGKVISTVFFICTCAGIASGERGCGGVAGSVGDDEGDVRYNSSSADRGDVACN